MYKPRPYQKGAVEKAVEFFKSKSKKRPIIYAPTASGKSIIIAFITRELKENTLVLQPSKELLEQNYGKFIECGGEASIYSASCGSKEIGDVTFATIGSIRKNPELFKHKKNVIIDECDSVPPVSTSMYRQFFKGLDKKTKYLGLTATPFRNKTYFDMFTEEQYTQTNLLNREKPKFFNEFQSVIQIQEMYALGFLAPIKWIQLDWDSGALKRNSTGAEFKKESMDKALDINKINKRIPNVVKQAIEKGKKHILVFVKNVSDAEILSRIVPDSNYVHAKTKKKERKEILDKFKSGEIKIIFNVGILTIGFDFPELDTIILARPTMSLRLYMQMVGRGIRIHESKEYCVVLDMCGNYERFGKIEDIELVEEECEQTLKKKWVLRNTEKILTGVRLEL